MPSPTQTQERAFKKEYSRFKLQMYFYSNKSVTYYSQELYGYTVRQVGAGYLAKVILDRERGLQDCIDHIARMETRYGPFTTALIYDNFKHTVMPDTTVFTGKVIRKYVSGKLELNEENIFLSDNEKKTFFKVEFLSGNMYKLVETKIEEQVILPPEKVDFKKEVTDNIDKIVLPELPKTIITNSDRMRERYGIKYNKNQPAAGSINP